MSEPFQALVDIFAVPPARHRSYYKKDWKKRPLFSCLVTVDPDEGNTDVLHIRLRSLTDNSVIATAPYDGQHGVHNVIDSARHFVFTVRNRTMQAWLGVKFHKRSDSSLFSLAIQKFMLRRLGSVSGFTAWPSLHERVEHSGAV